MFLHNKDKVAPGTAKVLANKHGLLLMFVQQMNKAFYYSDWTLSKQVMEYK